MSKKRKQRNKSSLKYLLTSLNWKFFKFSIGNNQRQVTKTPGINNNCNSFKFKLFTLLNIGKPGLVAMLQSLRKFSLSVKYHWAELIKTLEYATSKSKSTGPRVKWMASAGQYGSQDRKGMYSSRDYISLCPAGYTFLSLLHGRQI